MSKNCCAFIFALPNCEEFLAKTYALSYLRNWTSIYLTLEECVCSPSKQHPEKNTNVHIINLICVLAKFHIK